MHLDLEELNRYALAAIGVFAMFLYVGCLWAGVIEFRSWISSSNGNKKRSRKRARLADCKTRRLREIND